MHVRDTVRAVIELVQSASPVGQIFNIGSDEAITIRQLAELVIKLVDESIKIEHISYGQAFGAGFEDVRCRIPDLTRLRATLNFVPKFSLADILQEVIASERSRQTKSKR
jgi:UDP-glucose 4-epimerase